MLGGDDEHQARIAVVNDKGLQRLILGSEIDAVIEIAGNDIGAAADDGGERLRAALEIDDLDLKPGFLVLAQLLSQHRR